MAGTIGKKTLLSMFDNADVFVAIAAIGVVLMLIIPLPPAVLDVLLILNLSLAIMIILSTIYIKKPADFSSFPTLILMTTVFGLALNVSSTRLILTEGYAGNIINAFGNFVIRDNIVVGLIIFIILLAIQFLVITKGASRVAEVAARFTLDAMPGKQLAVDADLNAGLITEDEAKARRNELRLETDFYGSMDGSSKFVSGNVKVALVVTLVDIIGGLIIGMVVKGYDVGTAATKYVMLTVGDGLISQIPAMLISTATGIIVTRAASTEQFGNDVMKQVGSSPQVLYVAGGTIFLMGLLPGFPTILNFLIGGLLAALGYLMTRSLKRKTEEKEVEAKSQKPAEQTTTIEDIVRVDPMNLEIGYNLIPLVDKQQGGDLLERIKLIRRRIGLDLGILVPRVRIIDNVGIDSSEYLVKIRGIEVGRGKVFINRLLVMNPKLDLNQIDGIEIKEPAFGLPAKWISEDQRQKAETMGFDIFDPPSVLATHLTEIIRKNAAELLNRQDVQSMLEALRKEYSAVVDEVMKIPGGIGQIEKVLQNLLQEDVSIRNLLLILETIADYAGSVKNADMLTEHVRASLSRQIAAKYAGPNNSLIGIIIDPELERLFAGTLQETPQGFVSTLDPQIIHRFAGGAGDVIKNVLDSGKQPIVMSSQKIRRLVREILERAYPSIPVLSYSEIPSNYSLDQVGMISFSE